MGGIASSLVRRVGSSGGGSAGSRALRCARAGIACLLFANGAYIPSPRVAVRTADWCVARPALYRIELLATERVPGATGVAWLRPPPSAFGVSVSENGSFVYDVEVSAHGLPAPATLGPYHVYVAWVATPDLDQVKRLDAIGPENRASGQVAWNKFMVFVTAEASAAGRRWSGPIVLRGMSASGYLQNFSSHPLFSGGVPPC
jgi:hypothetical protein